jgi:hypothetical protein
VNAKVPGTVAKLLGRTAEPEPTAKIRNGGQAGLRPPFK